MLGLAAQSALTFSRGGLYNAFGSILLASPFLVKDSRLRKNFVPLIAIAVLAAILLIMPLLDGMTGGTLTERFKNTDTTNRGDIAMVQLQIWLDHPLLGVGPGQAKSLTRNVAHTEVTRLLAEHGACGLLALMTLMVLAVRNIKRGAGAANKALSAAMIGWAILFMLNSGMRLVAPSFAFGLSFLMLLPAKMPARRWVLKRVPAGTRLRGVPVAPARLTHAANTFESRSVTAE